MIFREFVEQALVDYEQRLRREKLERPTIEIRLQGARQFAQLLLGEPPKGGPVQGEETNRGFGAPRN